MPGGLLPDGLQNGGPQGLAAEAPQGEFLRAVQAGLELPVGGEPDPGAAFAEAGAQGRNQPHPPGPAGGAVIPGDAAVVGSDALIAPAIAAGNGAAARQRRRRQGTPPYGARNKLRDGFQNRRSGEEGTVQGGGGADGHELDEADVPGVIPGQAGQLRQLVLVDALQQDRVEADPVKARSLGGGDARQDPVQLPAPGQGPVALRAEAVQADVQPVQARGPQGSGKLREQGPVGGHGQLLQTGGLQGRQPLHEAHDPPADQGLAAGEPDLPDPQRHEGGGQLRQLLQGADLPVAPLADPLRGHAVGAAEVAELRHGQAQIVDGPSEGVGHGSSFPLRGDR